MKIIESIKIGSTTDLIYAKISLKNYAKKYKVINFDLLVLGVMEIGTNILKHTPYGEIWFLDENGYLAIIGLDYGDGIENIHWALKNGTTSLKDSLGVGLYALYTNTIYNFEIFSITNNPVLRSGTIVGLFNNKNDIYLNIPLYPPYSGDFLLTKNSYKLIGDIAGHGVSAYKSLDVIKDIFLNSSFVCKNVDTIFNNLDKKLKQKKLRGFVGLIFYEDESNYNLCGVGNLSIFYKKNKEIKNLTLNEGMVGEVFDKTKMIKLKKNVTLIITSDGIEKKLLFELLKFEISKYFIAFGAIWFCGINDDKSILIK